MASFHCSAKVGAKGSGASHSEYISREGKYSKDRARRYEDLDSTGHGNMPAWAEENPAYFWHAADEYERANGSVYRELVVALPRELTPEQRRELVADFIAQEIGDRHAYQWAIHNPKAALDGGEQPHAHIMYSERIRDGHDRDPDHYFKRANKKNPERGGCVKASGGKSPAELKAELLATRERWANVQNAHLERHGHTARVDHRSLKDQGIDREPERHIGAKGVQRMVQADIEALLERRAAEGEAERAAQAVGLIDLSGSIAQAKEDRARDAARQVAQQLLDSQRAVQAQRARALQEKYQQQARDAAQQDRDWLAEVLSRPVQASPEPAPEPPTVHQAKAADQTDQAQPPTRPDPQPEPVRQVETIDQVRARHTEAIRQIEALSRTVQRPAPPQPNAELVELAARDAYVQAFRAREIEALGPIPEKAGLFGLKAKAYSRERADIERRAELVAKEIMGPSPKAVAFRREAVAKADAAYSQEHDQWRAGVLSAERKRADLLASPQYRSDAQRLEAHRAQQAERRQRAEQLTRPQSNGPKRESGPRPR